MFIHSEHPLSSGKDAAKIHKLNANQINNAKRDSYIQNIRNKNPTKIKKWKQWLYYLFEHKPLEFKFKSTKNVFFPFFFLFAFYFFENYYFGFQLTDWISVDFVNLFKILTIF